MENKYYLHRIQKENGTFTKGIEVHDDRNDAIRSYWGRVKTAYNAVSGMTFVSCKITDNSGRTILPYNTTWLKKGSEESNVFFLHSIRVDGETVTKTIDVYNTQDEAMVAFATAMEYGYNNPNPRFENISLVSCEITDLLSGGMVLLSETWQKPEPEPEPEEEGDADE